MSDIFVSYTSTDREWAFWVAKELEKLEHTPHVHEWEIKGGEDIYAWMESRHDASDQVLCGVSDEYLRAPYSTLERNAALWQAASKRPGFVLLVVVKACKLPTLSDHIRRCELFGISEHVARVRFRAFMKRPSAPEAVTFPGNAVAVSNIPIRVPQHFFGREDALVAVEQALKRSLGCVAITALHGLRGVGKTTLAAAYAERHRTDYRATWWIRAQTEPTMRADLVGLGVRLGWVAADDKEEPAVAAVVERLLHEGEGVLLVYDNAIEADSLKPYLPRGGAGSVLITSNAHAWRGVAHPVEIKPWSKKIGADYLLARTGRDSERAGAEALSESLGGLPLAHEQSAAYCEDLGIDFSEYSRRFEAAIVHFLDDKAYAPADYHPEYQAEHHDRLTVHGTFSLTIEEAGKRNRAAEPLIVYASLLAPEPIPLFLFAEAREKFGDPLASTLAIDGIDKAIAALRAFALIDRESVADERDPSIKTECIRLHRLVRQVAAVRREGEELAEAQRALVEALAAVCPENTWRDPETWPRMRRMDALIRTLLGQDRAVPPGAEVQAAYLLDSLAAYLHNSLADYPAARSLYERALTLREKELGAEHPDTAYSLNSLGRLLHAQGNLQEAQSLFERALAIRENILGPDHVDTASSINNLGLLLLDRGWLSGAKPLFERALAVCENTLGPEHSHTATTLTNLGRLLLQQGDTNTSQQVLQRARVIFEKALGGEHPSTHRVRAIWARLLIELDRPNDALSEASAALVVHDKALGLDHPWTKDSVDAKADALAALGRGKEAKALREKYRLEHYNLFGAPSAR